MYVSQPGSKSWMTRLRRRLLGAAIRGVKPASVRRWRAYSVSKLSPASPVMIRIVRATCDCGTAAAHLASGPCAGRRGRIALRAMVHVVRYESPEAWAEHVAARFAAFLAD